MIHDEDERTPQGRLSVNSMYGAGNTPLADDARDERSSTIFVDSLLKQDVNPPAIQGGSRKPPLPKYELPGDFPWQALPETIRGAVQEICENDKLAVPLAVQATLAAVSVVCQDLIMVDRGFGEVSVCSLFMMAVADSGARKTRADRAVTPTIEKNDRGRAIEYERAKTAYENEQKVRRMKERALERTYIGLTRKAYAAGDEKAEVARESLKEIEGLLEELRSQPLTCPEPHLRRSLYSSISMRELERSLCENWPSAGLVSSEAADILNARSESDMARLDRLWDGQGIDVVGRTARESFSVSDPRLTVSLMIQPTVFDRFIERKGDQAKGVGFIPRTLISRPETPYGQRQADSAAPRSRVWTDIFNRRVLDLLDHGFMDIGQRAQCRKVLYFSSAAQLLWETDHNEKEAQTVDNGRYVHEREFVNRYSEHVARLAALFHFFETYQLAGEDHSGRLEIPESTVKAAINVCEWYLSEFSRIFNPEKAIEEAAEYVLKKLRERVASKNGGELPDETLSNRYLELPENELRLFCSRYGLKTDTAKFKMVLDWLADKKYVSRHSISSATTGKSTATVRLEISRNLSYHQRRQMEERRDLGGE
ncbi:YfjI family protein [Cupriavidus sp. 30B13]|uniref:YfjI family protein n=1 Tax=Cupriavidus sp. 30B13 TaxID=3384241 RepID=UPI003B909B9F